MENLCLKILEQRGIKPTAIRMLVLKAMIDAEQAVSLLDLENKLEYVKVFWRYRGMMVRNGEDIHLSMMA